MATLEEKLTAILTGICPRSFPDFAPPDTERPYVTWQQIGGEIVVFLEGQPGSKENAYVQVNVWADRRASAKDLIKQIEAALTAATTVLARPMSASASDFDADMKVYGSRQDFSIWADR